MYENGAKEDVSKANNEGLTPMHIASKNGHLRVCEWLILNGILTDERLLNDDKHKNTKNALLEWATEVIATNNTFINVLPAIMKESSSERAQPHINKLSGENGLMQLVKELCGAEVGLRLRNVLEWKASIKEIQETANEEKK